MNNNLTQKMSQDNIDELAMMIKKGFDEVGNQFKESYKYMNRRFDEIDKRFDDVYKRLDVIDSRLGGIDKRLVRIEDKLDNIENVVFKDHSVRIRRVERKLAIS